MSLKFGIYLVEQRIVTPEQFCGLIKIQQESTRSLASLAIANNYLTMKQVSRVLDGVEQDESKFIDFALTRGFIERTDAQHLSKLQEQSGESIRHLAVECGLITSRQAEVLFNHFQRYGARKIEVIRRPVTTKQGQATTTASPTKPRPVVQPNSTPTPKFKQHPIIKAEEARH